MISIRKNTGEALVEINSNADEIISSRGNGLLLAKADQIQYMNKNQLAALQEILQHGGKFGCWVTQKRWVPVMQKSALDIDLRSKAISYLPDDLKDLIAKDDKLHKELYEKNLSPSQILLSPIQIILEGAVVVMMRYLLLCRIGPAGIGLRARNRSLDPSTLMRIAYQQLPQLISVAIAKNIKNYKDINGKSLRFISCIKYDDLKLFTSNTRKFIEIELSRMGALTAKGCWSDAPMLAEKLLPITAVRGMKTKVLPECIADPHLPLPDAYVAEIGRNCLWLIQELGPDLVAIVKNIKSIWTVSENKSLGVDRVAQVRAEKVNKMLAAHVWLGSNGDQIKSPPFAFRETRTGKNSRISYIRKNTVSKRVEISSGTWHPKSFVDVILLCKLLQSANLFIVGLSMGARRSELVDLKRDCLVESYNGAGTLTGITWKLVDRHEGVVREWVLPDLAVQAVKQQVELVELLDGIGPMTPRRIANDAQVSVKKHLWASLGGGQSNRSNPLINTSNAFGIFAKNMGMVPNPGGQSLRVHRLRKTIARLAALALVQAPTILKDVFGHKSIEMTMYYILTDKDLQADIERVSRELRIMKAKETVQAMIEAENEKSNLQFTFGGGGAAEINRAINTYRNQVHQRGEEWGADSVSTLADILTLQGKAWNLVRPGIICTKFPGTESGPCNKSKGNPEPSRCQSHCKHRLEEGFLRADVDGAINEALIAYFQACEQEDDLAQSLWIAQIRLHLDRFKDIREKWLQEPKLILLFEKGVLE